MYVYYKKDQKSNEVRTKVEVLNCPRTIPAMIHVNHASIQPILAHISSPPALSGRKSSFVSRPHQLYFLCNIPKSQHSKIKMGKSTDATRAERKAKKRALEAAIPDLPGDDNVDAVDEVATKPERVKKDKKRKRGDGDDAENGEAEVKSKKSKKEKKDKKSKKEEPEDAEEVEVEAETPAKKEKKSKKDKKASKSESESTVEEDAAPVEVDTPMEDAEAPKKSKKERKAERRAKEIADAANGTTKDDEAAEPVLETNGDGDKKAKKDKKMTTDTETAEEKKSKKNNRNREKKRKGIVTNGDAAAEGEDKDKKAARFIVFVGVSLFSPIRREFTTNQVSTGNLPFSATTESIAAHFASVHPQSVRHLTKKEDPTKSKGCAFIEFAGYDHMKTCLKLMHHSTFDDGKSAPRKINVELTYVTVTYCQFWLILLPSPPPLCSQALEPQHPHHRSTKANIIL